MEKSINALLNRPNESHSINTKAKVSTIELYVHNPPLTLNYQPESNPWIEVSIYITDLLTGINILSCPEFHNKLRSNKSSKLTPIVEKIQNNIVDNNHLVVDSETRDKVFFS